MSTTTRQAYRRTGTRHQGDPIQVPSTCDCGQTFPDLGGLLGHACPNDVRPGMRAARPADVVTTDADSLDVPEWRGGAKGHTPAPAATDAQLAFIAKLAAERDVTVDTAGMTKRQASAKITELQGQSRKAAAHQDQTTTDCRPNRYEGHCRHCGYHVPAGGGLLCRVDGAWAVEHHPGQCNPSDGDTAATPAPSAPAVDVPAGHYAIPSTGDNDLAFYRVDRPTEGDYAGRTFVKLVVGGHPDRNVPRSHVAGILARIAADPEAGPRYGQTIGRCCVCNRHLTDDESRAAGIGPDCAKRGGA